MGWGRIGGLDPFWLDLFPLGRQFRGERIVGLFWGHHHLLPPSWLRGIVGRVIRHVDFFFLFQVGDVIYKEEDRVVFSIQDCLGRLCKARGSFCRGMFFFIFFTRYQTERFDINQSQPLFPLTTYLFTYPVSFYCSFPSLFIFCYIPFINLYHLYTYLYFNSSI